MIGREELTNRFGFHKATIEGPNTTQPRHIQTRHLFLAFAERLDEILEDGRAKEIAYDRLEEAAMWSHKAIAADAPLIQE